MTTLLRNKFPIRVLSRNGDQDCDFYLWSYLKSHVDENYPRTIPQLHEEIRNVIAQLEEYTIKKYHQAKIPELINFHII